MPLLIAIAIFFLIGNAYEATIYGWDGKVKYQGYIIGKSRCVELVNTHPLKGTLDDATCKPLF